MKCPGTDTRFLRVEVRKCGKCGSDVEIFSDEAAVKCRQCGGRVSRKMPSCTDWCRYAGECTGNQPPENGVQEEQASARERDNAQ